MENNNMSKTDIKRMSRACLEMKKFILLAGLSCAMLAFTVFGALYKPAYSSSADIAVTMRGGLSSVSSNLKTAKSLADVLAEIVESNQF